MLCGRCLITRLVFNGCLFAGCEPAGKSIRQANLADLYSLPLEALRLAKKQSRFF
jgi:hypothetical protein